MALGLSCCTLSIVHHGCWGHLWCVAKVSGGQIGVRQCSKLTTPASPVLLPQDVDRIGLCMGQHSVSLHGVVPELLHTFHCTTWLLGASLVYGQGESRANWVDAADQCTAAQWGKARMCVDVNCMLLIDVVMFLL